MSPVMTEPKIGETTEILVGGGIVERVTILDIDHENNFILGQKNPAMIAGPQASEGSRFRWPRRADEGEYQIDSEFIFFDDETGIFAVRYNG